MGVWFAMIFTFSLVAAVAYPEIARQLGEQTMTPEQMRSHLAELLPAPLFWSAAGAGAFVAIFAGWGIVRFRRFAGTSQAIFLAVVLFISNLQMAATAQSDLRWMPLVLVGLLPISVLAGGRIAVAMAPMEEFGAEA